ncbi:hypothetical protein SEUCBS139899_006125 [Sporothrix eucalyptigena]
MASPQLRDVDMAGPPDDANGDDGEQKNNPEITPGYTSISGEIVFEPKRRVKLYLKVRLLRETGVTKRHLYYAYNFNSVWETCEQASAMSLAEEDKAIMTLWAEVLDKRP